MRDENFNFFAFDLKALYAGNGKHDTIIIALAVSYENFRLLARNKVLLLKEASRGGKSCNGIKRKTFNGTSQRSSC